MNENKSVETNVLVSPSQLVIEPSASTVIVQGAVTVFIELGCALMLWQLTRLIEACKRPAK